MLIYDDRVVNNSKKHSFDQTSYVKSVGEKKTVLLIEF
jgi:hypothetical protein